MAPSQSTGSIVLRNLLDQQSFLDILKYYVDVACSIAPTGQIKTWTAINQHQRLTTLFDLEKKHGLVRKMDEAGNPHFRKALQENRTVLGEYLDLGFYDFFTPLRHKGENLGMLTTGVFTLREWTPRRLEESWTKISGQAASPANPGFLEFVRIALETPFLEGETLRALQEACDLFARILSGEGKGRKNPARLGELKLKVFSKHFPHGFWLDWALGLPSRYVMPSWSRSVEEWDWVRQEIGIQRIPTTVMAAIPLRTFGTKGDTVDDMLRVHRFQTRAFQFAKSLPQTVAGNLENYGVVFVTSADVSKNRLQRKAQIEETARKIHRFAKEVLEGPALVGVGETVAPGQPLKESYRQAVLSLHVGRKSGKEVVFFTAGREKAEEGIGELRRLLLELSRQFAAASFSDMEILRDGFLKQVLMLSFQSPEEIRWHLRYALIQIVEASRKRSDLLEREANELYESLVKTLEKAVTTQEMVLVFQEALRSLSQPGERPSALRAAYSIDKTREYIDDHFQEPMRISRLARMAKISTATFSRRFKKLTGTGLEAYLQNRRLEEAGKLLKAGTLPVSKVAHECGFKSVPHFIQVFRRKTGLPPQKFRRKFQGD